MPIYRDRILPRIMNRLMDNARMRAHRRATCAGLRGDVVEIGFGSGLNLACYPAGVTGVWAVEPAGLGFHLARHRLAASAVPVVRAGLDGQRLDLPDGRFDAALCTWTLCTIPDVGAALAELRRVLRPGAALHFIEHGLSPEATVARWQHRLDPLQRCLVGGCHLDRDIPALIGTAGFVLDELTVTDERPTVFAHQFRGVARA